MQIIITMGAKELRQMRKRWFISGFICALLIGIIMVAFLPSTGVQTTSTSSNYIPATYSILHDQIESVPAPLSVKPIQTKTEANSVESWGLIVFIPLVLIYILAMLTILFKKFW